MVFNNLYKTLSLKLKMDNYQKLIERISKASAFPLEEIERKVEAKKAKLSGLISKEGAAQIVAAELGINFDNEKLKISEIVQGMKRVNVVGKIIHLNPIREFNKNGREGKVASFTLADESSNIRTVLWDTNHIALLEKGKIKENDIVEISNAAMRNSELHLSSFADIKLSKETIEKVIEQKIVSEKKLKEMKVGDFLKTRALIVKSFEPRYFEICPECNKKALDGECKIHGKISPVKRAVLSIILDDGTNTTRSVLFGEQINKLGLTNEEIFSLEVYEKAKHKIIGEEKIFSGQVRINTFSNEPEISISDIEEVNPDLLIKELEQKIK